MATSSFVSCASPSTLVINMDKPEWARRVFTERVTIRFNWNASTTINKGIRYFSKVLTDGPISRINFCTIPEREIGAEMPVYGTYDDTFRENLKPYIEHLNMGFWYYQLP